MVSRKTASSKSRNAANVPASPLHVVILAAGQGTRMRSGLPKVLHSIAGTPMLGHVLRCAAQLGAEKCHIVVGHGAAQIRQWAAKHSADMVFAEQKQQLGTAHAVLQAMPNIPDEAQVLILYGDVPLIESGTLKELLAEAGAKLGVLTADADDPAGYGRILRHRSGSVQAIVEEKDASPDQRKISEINTGVMCAPASLLRNWLQQVRKDNAKAEYYLTDIVALAAKDRIGTVAVMAASLAEVSGVNDRAQLAEQERVFQRRQASELMRLGTSLSDPARLDVRGSLLCGQDVHLDVGVVIEGEVELGDNVYVGPYTLLRNAKIGSDTRIESHCVVDDAIVGRGCRIGPFARLRPQARLANEVHVGNFVEIKKSSLGDGAKANHLAYIGDATVGSKVNIGAGVITCNYDGANKHQTVIGDGAFIGTDTQLIAPVTIGPGAYIAAGSSIARDAPPDQLTICRARDQRAFKGWKRPEKK